MKTNRLGKSELRVSEIGFGTMSLGNNEKQDIRMIREAIEGGVNFFDTADLYHFGAIEKTLGKALKGRRDEVVLATKAGNRWEEGKDGWYWDPSKAYLKEALKKSLQRLETDYVDLFQLHGGTIDDPIDESIEGLEELKQEGLIREYGISSIRPNVIREYVKRSNMVSVMMQYSILDRRPEEEMLALLAENDISVIARGPIAKGMLTERAKKKTPEKGFLGYERDEIVEIAKKVEAMASDTRTPAQIALRYSLSHPAVAAAVPGASSSKQLQENIGAANAALTEAELADIRGYSRANVYEKHR
ncbi:MAG TPA: aldo/keto reductase [Bacillales bacterium]|nr:aldo/keto reductase [Bacillales bacterium]